MNTENVLEKVKSGEPFLLVNDTNLLGEASYQEFLFYVSGTSQFFIQCLDWVEFEKCGFNQKRSIMFEKVTDNEASMRVELVLEKTKNDKSSRA